MIQIVLEMKLLWINIKNINIYQKFSLKSWINLEKILILEMIEILNNKRLDMKCFSIYQKFLEKINFL